MENVLVSFPGLGLDIELSRVAFRVFGVPIYWYGIIISLAFVACVLWAMRDSKRFGYDQDIVIDLVLVAIPVCIVCARLFFVVFSWDMFKDNLLEIFNVRHGGLAIWGGIIGAVISGTIIVKWKKIQTLKFFDFAIVYVPLGQAIGRWGNFFNQEAFGTNTTLPWGMTSPEVKQYLTNNLDSLYAQNVIVYPDIPVHPTFLYESIWNLALFGFLYFMRGRKKFDGQVFCLYFIGYGIARAFIETLRTDALMIGSLRIAIVMSVLGIIAFTIFMFVLRNRALNNDVDAEVVGESKYAEILKTLNEEAEQSAVVQVTESPMTEDSESAMTDDSDSAIAEDTDSVMVEDSDSAMTGDSESAIIEDSDRAMRKDSESATIGEVESSAAEEQSVDHQTLKTENTNT